MNKTQTITQAILLFINSTIAGSYLLGISYFGFFSKIGEFIGKSNFIVGSILALIIISVCSIPSLAIAVSQKHKSEKWMILINIFVNYMNYFVILLLWPFYLANILGSTDYFGVIRSYSYIANGHCITFAILNLIALIVTTNKKAPAKN